MKIISYLNNDQLNKPNTSDAPVYTVEHPAPTSREQLIEKHPTVFSKRVQRHIHELIEGLQGVEIIADDSVAVGFGNSCT